jgi:SagB-type dehydrogenase family enzyme
MPSPPVNSWPASQAYHLASNLNPGRLPQFGQTITQFAACVAAGKVPPSRKSYPGRPTVTLPPGDTGRGLSLAEALRHRRTRRVFSGGPITLPRLAALLRSAAGITGHAADVPAGAAPELRAWPSAGGLYPLEIYLLPLLADGFKPAIYHHNPHDEALTEIAPPPSRADLEKIVLASGLWNNASLLIVITGVFARTQAKYGERGYRFIQQEAGHLMQNLLLAAEELSLNAVALGGFFEDELERLLSLDPAEESPVYAALLGSM